MQRRALIKKDRRDDLAKDSRKRLVEVLHTEIHEVYIQILFDQANQFEREQSLIRALQSAGEHARKHTRMTRR